MPCYKPLKGFPIGVTENGKPNYKVVSYDVARIDVIPSSGSLPPRYVYVTDNMISSGYTVTPGSTQQISYFVELPCGKCEGCRIAYSRAWADRCMLELQDHNHAWFVTLTYDDEHLHKVLATDDSGEIQVDPIGNDVTHMTLIKRDFQLFMKSLRRKVEPDKLRFFACGEYGSQTFRPHYHAIIFGLNLQDDQKEFYKRDPSGKFNYYKSDFLANIWQKGFVVIGNVTWETCAYTARYIMKKLKGPEAQVYTDLGIEPPFSLMSRKPGIGRNYYDTHPELFDYETINISTATGGRQMMIPKYFDKLLAVDDPDRYEKRRQIKIETMKNKKELELSQTDLSYLELLETKRQSKINSLKKLIREL